MGANADPSGSLGGPHRHPSPAAVAVQHVVAGSTAAALRHDPGPRGGPPRSRPGSTTDWPKQGEQQEKKEELSVKKSKENKERVTDSSTRGPAHLIRPSVPPYSLPVLPIDTDAESYKAIGGPTGELLERNAHLLNQIYTDISNMQVQENLSLLCETRDNIVTVLGQVSNAPDIMRQMPPLPVKLMEDLAILVLPRPPHPPQPRT